MGEVELAEAIATLREQIELAVADGAGRDVRFELGPIEMEFTVELVKEARGGVTAKIWGVGVDGGGSANSAHANRVKLVLTPRRKDGGDVQVAGDGTRAGSMDYSTVTTGRAH